MLNYKTFNRKIYIRPLLIFLLGFVIFSSCKNKNKFSQTNTKTIVRFDSLVNFNPFNVKDTGIYKYSVVVYLNTSCPVCLSEIGEWNNIANQFLKYSCNIRMVCNSDDYFEYFKYLCRVKSIKQFPFPFLLDTTNNYKFGMRNDIFLADSTDKTVLINNKNIVLATGNPVHNRKILNRYIQIVAQNINNK